MNQFEMKQKAYQTPLKSRALSIFLYLIDRANREGTCFPSIPTISRDLHVSVSTVKRALRELVEGGYIQKESRFREKNHGQTSNLYTICFPENEGEPEPAAVVEKNVEELKKKGKEPEIKGPATGLGVWKFQRIRKYPDFFGKKIRPRRLLFVWPGEGVSLHPP